MTDTICRKSMQRCLTPGMCAPHGGCHDQATGGPEAAAAIATLTAMGFAYNGGQRWKPPLGQKPDFDLIDQLRCQLEVSEDTRQLLRKCLAQAESELDALRAAPKYPISHGTNIIQFGEETFLWYDEAGLQGGVTYTLKSAEAALLRYVERLNPSPRPDGRPAGCCCPPPGHTGIWAGAMCPVHQGLRRQVL